MSELRPFTHRIYVDFSGDDGDPRTPGASASITAAWVICKDDAIRHNQDIVLAIKKLIGCKPKDNLRYRTLRRHPKRRQALGLLSGLRGRVILVPVLKKYVQEEEFRNPKTKRLVSILHTLPLHRVFDSLLPRDEEPYIQLILDEVSWALCKAEVRSQLRADERLDWSRARPDWLLFAKSGSNPMLQLADILAGMGREYVESLPARLPPCQVCHIKRNQDCSYRRARKPVGQFSLLRTMYPLLLRNEEGQVWEVGLLVRPPGIAHRYRFMDCLLAI